MLENLLGVKLLNRTSRKISLTDEGSEFLQYASQAVDIISSGENRVQNMAQGRIGHIRIAALSSISHQLSACLVRLYAHYPTVQVDVDLLEGTELINSVQKESYDFYFSIKDMISGTEDYELAEISKDDLELYVNTRIIDAIDLNDWSTVKRHPFVSIRKSDAWLTSRIRLICKNRGFAPNIINYYNRAEAVILAVNAGIGVAILPGALKQLYQHPNVIALPIEGNDAAINYVFAWRSSTKTSACEVFKDIVLSLFAED